MLNGCKLENCIMNMLFICVLNYESKGGIHSYEIESDSKIYPYDFTWTEGLILLPSGEFWSFIDCFQFRGEDMEPYDHLDNYGKSSSLTIFRHSK